MGQILSQPVRDKHSAVDGDAYTAYATLCMQGWRISMEDAHCTVLDVSKPLESTKNSNTDPEIEALIVKPPLDKHVAFYGVYDGHGGHLAADFTGVYLHRLVAGTDAYRKGDYVEALTQGFLACDQAILRAPLMQADESGCATTTALVTPSHVYCANAGDSRTVLGSEGYAIALLFDHKPNNDGELARISAAGGYVSMGRVNGNLALSRGIGDFEFKKNLALPAEEQIVTCMPEVIKREIDYVKDEFIILACDGIWDCLLLQQCVECVCLGISERKPLTQICNEIMELCCAPNSEGTGIGCDNMSITIVALLDHAKSESLDAWYDRVCARILLKNGSAVLPPYLEMYKDRFGAMYLIRGAETDDDDDTEIASRAVDSDEPGTDDMANGAVLLQQLLDQNALTSENGVLYLNKDTARLIMAQLVLGQIDGGDPEEKEELEEKIVEMEKVGETELKRAQQEKVKEEEHNGAIGQDDKQEKK